MILEYLESYLRQQAELRAKEPNNPFRASSMGRCIREGCYDLLGLPGEPLQPRRMLTLMNGTVIHDDLLTPLLKKAMGWRFVDGASLGDNFVEIDGVKIGYHIDGAFQHTVFKPKVSNYDNQIYNVGESSIGVIEIKSMSDYAFNRAVKGEIDRDYLCQAFIYYKGTDFNPVVFLAFRKETSHMCEIVFSRDCMEKVVTQRLTGNPIELAKNDPILLTEIRSPFDESVEEYVRERIKWLKLTEAGADIGLLGKNVPGADAVEDEIETIHGKEKAQTAILENHWSEYKQSKSGYYYFKTGRKVLGFPCSYCAHRGRCYPSAAMEMKGDKPIWVLPNREA